MTTFGLDPTFVKKMRKDLDIAQVRRDALNDFFFLPQFDVIYKHSGERLKQLVCEKLSKSAYGPKLPLSMEVPKGSRVSSRTLNVLGPNYYRPGSVLYPDDRLVYHFIGQEVAKASEKTIDRDRVFSHVPAKPLGSGFTPASAQWNKLKLSFENQLKTKKYSVVMKCDIAQYFSNINQHELVNQLEHQGLSSEISRFAEKFLGGLTLDRSSRGLVQGSFASDLLGNGFLTGIDDYIKEKSVKHYRYVDDIYMLFESNAKFQSFFPDFVKRLREWDLALNERKTFASAPLKLLKEETELDKAIAIAKKEAKEKLTESFTVEIDGGPYDDETFEEVLESVPNDSEVELAATKDIFGRLFEFKGEERDRAETFCLSLFKRASDPIAINHVIKRWSYSPEKAREYAMYLNKFVGDEKSRAKIDKELVASASTMVDFQWAWGSVLVRRMSKISSELLGIVANLQKDGSRHDVVRSLLTYAVCRHGSPHRKKEIRDNYGSSPLLIQLSTIHASKYFTLGERNALMKTAEAQGELQALTCEAVKADLKMPSK
jgi:hypothetical protein